MSEVIVSVRNLAKDFVLRHGFHAKGGVFRAVDNVSFELRAGEILGLVGESGSGKTTTARCIVRAHRPTSGHIIFSPQGLQPVDLALASDSQMKALRPKLQMIFQDPYSSLNPRMTVGDIVAEPLIVQNSACGSELRDKVEEVLRRVGLPADCRNRYPHGFSGGQRQRIGIARALIVRPSLVVADEVVSALDVSVQAQVLNLFKDLQAEYGLTWLFVAHNLDVVRFLCDRIAVMQSGRIVEIGPTAQIFHSPQHPYTRALLASAPVLSQA